MNLSSRTLHLVAWMGVACTTAPSDDPTSPDASETDGYSTSDDPQGTLYTERLQETGVFLYAFADLLGEATYFVATFGWYPEGWKGSGIRAPDDDCGLVGGTGTTGGPGFAYPPREYPGQVWGNVPDELFGLVVTIDGTAVRLHRIPPPVSWVGGATVGVASTEPPFELPELFVMGPAIGGSARLLPDGGIEVTWTPTAATALSPLALNASFGADSVSCIVFDDGSFVIPPADAAVFRSVGRLELARGTETFVELDDFGVRGGAFYRQSIQIR